MGLNARLSALLLRTAGILITLFLISADALAQTHTKSINFGQPVYGVITYEAYEEQWTFHSEAGITIQARMEATSGDLDPYLRLLDAAGNVIAEDDDGGGNSNSAFSYLLNQTGDYTIIATRFGGKKGDTTGSYRLTLNASAAATMPQPVTASAGGGTIEYGQTVSGAFGGAHYEDRWMFEGQAGDVVTVCMEAISGNLDSYLRILNPTDITVDADDDGGSGLNSLITYVLPHAGRYTIITSRFGHTRGTSVGEYALTLQLVTATSTQGATGPAPIPVDRGCTSTLAPRMTVGYQGVSASRNTLNLRDAPQGRVVGQMEYGDTFDVLDGPTGVVDHEGDCLTWWRIKAHRTGIEGWVVEGFGGYWIAPLTQLNLGAPIAANPNVVCSNTLPTRMQVGYQGQTDPNDPTNTVMRVVPAGDVVGEVRPGTGFDVIDGPRCANVREVTYTWYKVRVHGSGLVGWLPEGSRTVYWLQPLGVPNQR